MIFLIFHKLIILIYDLQVDFFIKEKPTLVKFFKKFNYKLKKIDLSAWCSVLNANLRIFKDNQKLIQLERNYKSGYYTEAMNNCYEKL